MAEQQQQKGEAKKNEKGGAQAAAAAATADAENRDQKAIDAALKLATAAPVGMELVDFSPMESIPTLSVESTISGEGEIKKGMTISGIFLETERLVSDKFTQSQETDPETGKKVQYRHVLQLADKSKVAIWNTGELKPGFKKIQPGTFVSLTYNGCGQNSKGQKQHFFSWKTSPVPAPAH